MNLASPRALIPYRSPHGMRHATWPLPSGTAYPSVPPQSTTSMNLLAQPFCHAHPHAPCHRRQHTSSLRPLPRSRRLSTPHPHTQPRRPSERKRPQRPCLRMPLHAPSPKDCAAVPPPITAALMNRLNAAPPVAQTYLAWVCAQKLCTCSGVRAWSHAHVSATLPGPWPSSPSLKVARPEAAARSEMPTALGSPPGVPT